MQSPKLSSPSKPLLTQWRSFLWRWHRRLGLMSAVVFIIVCVSGILLNHTSELALGNKPVRQAWLLSHYGVPLPKFVSYAIDEHWVSGDDNQYIYLDGVQVAYCRGDLVGVAKAQGLLVAACAQELLLFTETGELVERLGASYGLPVPVESIGACAQEVCLQVDGVIIAADFQQLVWTQVSSTELSPQSQWSQSQSLPDTYREKLLREQLGTPLAWERVMQDLHSGRIAGNVGVWVVDLAAILLLFLALSGFLLWYQQWRRTKR